MLLDNMRLALCVCVVGQTAFDVETLPTLPLSPLAC